MSTEHPDSPQSAPVQPHPVALEALETEALLESYVRLQQSQVEFLAWLDATEHEAEIDRYIYRKIR